MSALAQGRMIPAEGVALARPSPLFTVRLLLALARFTEAYAWSAFAAVSLACGWGHAQALISRRLDFDELFTFYIADASSVRNLLELTHRVDFHPPLSYLLVRASFAIFGVSSWSCRLPFLLAFHLTAALLFWFVKRLLSPLYGLIAVLLLWSVPLSYLSTEARPYSLLLCFTTLMLVSWHEATREDRSSRRRLPLAALMAGGFGLLLSHVLGLLPYAVLFAAEFLRLWIRRKPDWRLWAALTVPLFAIVTHLALIRTHNAMLFAQEYRITSLRMFVFYWESIRCIATPLAVIAALAWLWPARREQSSAAAPVALAAMGGPLRMILIGLSIIPLVVGGVFACTGAYFFDRYGIVWLIPLTLVPVLVLGYCTNRDPLAGTVVALVLATVLFFNTAGKAWLLEQLASVVPPSVAAKLLYSVALVPIYPPSNYPPVPAHLQAGLANAPRIAHLETVEPELPLVAHTALTFLELDQRENAHVQQRLYLLTDENAAATIAHDTVFAHFERVKEVFPIRGKVASYARFISEHPRFLVVGAYDHPLGWLLRKLERDGAELRVVGLCSGNTEDCQIYEVRVRDAHSQKKATSSTHADAE